MHVDRAEARHVERRLRDLPGEAPARQQVGLVRADEPLDRVLVPGEQQVDTRRRARRRELEERRRLVALGAPCREHRDGLVAESRSAPESASAIGLIVQIMNTRQDSAM